jgi:hypothetical protein
MRRNGREKKESKKSWTYIETTIMTPLISSKRS